MGDDREAEACVTKEARNGEYWVCGDELDEGGDLDLLRLGTGEEVLDNSGSISGEIFCSISDASEYNEEDSQGGGGGGGSAV